MTKHEYRIGDAPGLWPCGTTGRPAILSGLDYYPVVGDRFEVHGELWRVVEVSRSCLGEREPS